MVRKISLISLSCGLMGEPFVKHELEQGIKRLNAYGFKVCYTPNAMKGIDYLDEHPEERAQDWLEAFADPETDMILCAIGGDDTYRLLPYLFENNELKNVLTDKIFLGFSDTTVNHLMLHKLGMRSFYGQAFLPDVCELADEMLPYTRQCFEELTRTGRIGEIRPSEFWYEEREDFSPAAIGTDRVRHPNHGFELLQGSPRFSGEILGGCIESMCDLLEPEKDKYQKAVELNQRYALFPSAEEWRGKILLLETSEEQPEPEYYRRMVRILKKRGIFDAVSGVICGKPMDEKYNDEYRRILTEEIGNAELSVVWNINVGHATPRCIIPLSVPATVDVKDQVISFHYED